MACFYTENYKIIWLAIRKFSCLAVQVSLDLTLHLIDRDDDVVIVDEMNDYYDAYNQNHINVVFIPLCFSHSLYFG